MRDRVRRMSHDVARCSLAREQRIMCDTTDDRRVGLGLGTATGGVPGVGGYALICELRCCFIF